MLDELDAIVNGGQSIIVLSVLSNPGCVLAVSGGLFSSIEGFVSFDILNGLSEVGFSLGECFDGVVSQFGVSSLLGDVVVDISVQIEEDLQIIVIILPTLSQAAKSVLLTAS